MRKKKKKQTAHEAATAIRQANSVVARSSIDTASPVTAEKASAPEKRKASDAAVASYVPSSPKKRKLASQIAMTGKAALLKKKTKATTSAKKVKAKAQASVRMTAKAASTRAANAVIAQFGSNETMVTSRFANAHPCGLRPLESSYALCETKKRRAQPIL